MATSNWYSNSTELVAFGRVLFDADAIDTGEEIFYYLEKPFKYNTEHAIWVQLGKPNEDDDEWDNFIDALEEATEEDET